MATLTEQMIREILRYPARFTVPQLAEQYGISTATVYATRNGRIWSMVAPELQRNRGRWPVEDGSELQRKQEAQVRMVLETLMHSPARIAADAAGCSVWQVRDIRRGRRLAHILPELPRRGAGECPERAKRMASDKQLALVEDALRWPAEDSLRVISERHGVSRAYVSQIRRGDSLAWVLPDRRRVWAGSQRDHCAGCTHGGEHGHCGMGFPEAWTQDALDCSAYFAR